MAKKNKMLRRQEATEKTLKRFNNRPFEIGEVDCGQLVLFHLRALGIKIPKNKLQNYKSLVQARAAIREAYGVTSLEKALDKWLDRINVANAVLGDIIALPAHEDQHGLGALAIYLGNGAALMFEQDQPTLVSARMTFDPEAPPLAAWRAVK